MDIKQQATTEDQQKSDYNNRNNPIQTTREWDRPRKKLNWSDWNDFNRTINFEMPSKENKFFYYHQHAGIYSKMAQQGSLTSVVHKVKIVDEN